MSRHESEPLITTGESRSSPSQRNVGDIVSAWCNRAVLAALLVALISVTLMFNRRMSEMTTHLAAEDEEVDRLKTTLDEQADVIRRFSDSVTNKDVLERVDALEDRLNVSEHDMNERLDEAEERIGNLLNDTLARLDTIVNASVGWGGTGTLFLATYPPTHKRASKCYACFSSFYVIVPLQLRLSFPSAACLTDPLHFPFCVLVLLSDSRTFSTPMPHSQAQRDIHEEVSIVKTDVDAYVRTTQDQFSMENSFMVYQLAGTFTLLACLISMWHMTAHLRFFREPFVQRKILAILWMSPLYAITSWLSLVFPLLEGYLAVIKDFYEAYVIYQFLSFCIAVLGRGDRSRVVDLLVGHADHLEPPFRLCGKCCPKKYDSDRDMAEEVLLQCQAFTMQFVFIRPLTTIGTFICNKVGYYGAGDEASDYRSPQFWFLMIQNVSVFTAFSGLLKFYHAVQEDLAWCRPFPKFLCIKGIVFMTFWQGLVIAILAKTIEQPAAPGVVQAANENGGGEDEPDIWAKQAQNFLICLEMLGFSIAHFYCFPVEEWEEGYRPKAESDAKFGDNIALRDFFSDLKLILRGNKKQRRKSKKDQDEEQQGGGNNEGDDDMTAKTGRSTDDSFDDEDMTPQMKMAAARLMASLSFAGTGHGFIDDADVEEGAAGLMEKIARSGHDSGLEGEDYDEGTEGEGDKENKDRGLNGSGGGGGGSYGAMDVPPHSTRRSTTSSKRSKFDKKAASATSITEGEAEEEGGEEGEGPSATVEGSVALEGTGLLAPSATNDDEDGEEEEEDDQLHTENEELLRPSIFTTANMSKRLGNDDGKG